MFVVQVSNNLKTTFYWLNTEIIGILRQLKSTSTETEISRAHKGICLSDGLEIIIRAFHLNSNEAAGYLKLKMACIFRKI